MTPTLIASTNVCSNSKLDLTFGISLYLKIIPSWLVEDDEEVEESAKIWPKTKF